MRSALCAGRVSHSRLSPRRHAFTYRLFMLRLDLADLPDLDRRMRLFGTRWWKPVRFEPSDFMGVPRGGTVASRTGALRAAVVSALAAHGVTAPVARLEVLAHARIGGWVFNPVSFFIARDAADEVVGIVADVHNTFGERHAYVVPASAAAGGTWDAKKVFHVSPFFTLDGTYRFAFTLADDAADIRIALTVDGAPVFTSRLDLRSIPLTDGALARALTRFQSMTARVIGAIHWEALRLWRRGLPYRPRPAYDPEGARRATRA